MDSHLPTISFREQWRGAAVPAQEPVSDQYMTLCEATSLEVRYCKCPVCEWVWGTERARLDARLVTERSTHGTVIIERGMARFSFRSRWGGCYDLACQYNAAVFVR
jgi:hypothetical protein